VCYTLYIYKSQQLFVTTHLCRKEVLFVIQLANPQHLSVVSTCLLQHELLNVTMLELRDLHKEPPEDICPSFTTKRPLTDSRPSSIASTTTNSLVVPGICGHRRKVRLHTSHHKYSRRHINDSSFRPNTLNCPEVPVNVHGRSP